MLFSIFDIFFLNKEAGKLAGLLGIRLGMNIAEIGAGKGRLSALLAQVVGPSGSVFATEFDESKLGKIRKVAQKKQIPNLHIALAKGDSPNLPDQEFDRIIMSKVYHHFVNATEQNASFYAHLKPEGLLAIVDFEPKWYLKLSVLKDVPKSYGGHGIFKKILIDEVEQAGFVLKRLAENFGPGGMYCAIFNKK